MKLPSPRSLGLPRRFEELREGQWEAIQLALRRSPRFEGINAPTGFGKTLAYVAPALMTGRRTLILVQTRELAKQTMDQFAEAGLLKIEGQHNYNCNYDPLTRLGHVKVDEGPCHIGASCELRTFGTCDYYKALFEAKGGELVITNYTYRVLTNQNLDGGLGDFDLTILDEAHLAPDALSTALAVEVPYTLATYRQIEPLPRTDDAGSWAHWFMRQTVKIANALEEATARAKIAPTVALLRQVRRFRHFLSRFGLGTRITDAWVIERSDTKVVWQPIWPGPYAEAALFRWSPKVMLYSAALRPKTMDLLGIPEHNRAFHEFDSTFPVYNRAVTVIPTARIDARTSPEVRGQWLARHREIVSPRRDRAGIIHTHSYPRAREIAAYLGGGRGGIPVLVHDPKGTRETIARFKAAGGLLASPVIGTGIDFPNAECRYQIISKVPFLDTREGLAKARCDADPDYRDYSAANEILQIAGRPVRSETDWAETFIIDDHFRDWFFRKAYAHWPSYFRQAVRTSLVVPEPPDLEKGP